MRRTPLALACLPLCVLAASAVAPAPSAPVELSAEPVAVSRPAPGLVEAESARRAGRDLAPVPREPVVPGLGEALQAQATAAPEPQEQARVAPTQLISSGVPVRALAAYVKAAQDQAGLTPGCNLSWPVLAAIGRVESDHGRYGGSTLGEDGRPAPAIIGPQLNGAGDFASIADSDRGTLDGDTEFDRAVGPMQFIPTTWATSGRDGDGDGTSDPQDLDDAAAAAAGYLCAGGKDLATGSGLGAAIFSYNHSDDYVRLVAEVATRYAAGEGGT